MKRQFVKVRKRHHALSAGMNGHIAKPIDPPTLYRTIAESLNASNDKSNQ
jgi:CheY-like chemotaxis protein